MTIERLEIGEHHVVPREVNEDNVDGEESVVRTQVDEMVLIAKIGVKGILKAKLGLPSEATESSSELVSHNDLRRGIVRIRILGTLGGVLNDRDQRGKLLVGK